MELETNRQNDRRMRPDASRKASKVLDVADQLFLKQGFGALTMDAVSRAAGVSKATLYAHFKSKEALFTAVVAAEAARINDQVWPSSDKEHGHVADTLRQLARNFFSVFINERTFLMQRAIIEAMTHHPALGRYVLDVGHSALLGKIADFLTKADAGGTIDVPNPQLAAAQFLSLASCDVHTMGLLTLQPPSQAEIDERIEGAVSMFMSHYGTGRPKPSQS